MDELQELKKLLEEGFKPAMVLLEVSDAEADRRGLPMPYHCGAARALPLAHTDGRKLMFCMINCRTIEYCEGLVRDMWQITGYNLCVRCAATGLGVALDQKAYLTDFVRAVKEDLGWDARETDYPNVFEVHFEIKGDDLKAVQNRVEAVERLALAASLQNRIGFVVVRSSPGEKYKGRPFAFGLGWSERHTDAPTADERARVDTLWQDHESRQAAIALQSIYSQVTEHALLIAAWAALEDLFPSKPEHLLDETELQNLAKAIDAIPSLSPDRKAKAAEALRDPNRMARQTRNERMAAAIAALLKQDVGVVLTEVKRLADARAKSAHSLETSTEDTADHVKFVERVLKAFIASRAKSP